MKKSIVVTITVICTLAVFQFDCKKESPVVPGEIPKISKRSFIWTIDTLSYPESYQTMMVDIWVDNPNNVFVVGHNDRGFGQMYHFDGDKWNVVKLEKTLSFAFDLRAIQGFAPNNIWAVGEQLYSSIGQPTTIFDSSLVIYFNGIDWSKIPLPNRGRSLVDINGTGLSNIWVGGVRGALYHFNGLTWKDVSLPDSFNVSSISTTDFGETYLTAYSFDDTMNIKRYFISVT